MRSDENLEKRNKIRGEMWRNETTGGKRGVREETGN